MPEPVPTTPADPTTAQPSLVEPAKTAGATADSERVEKAFNASQMALRQFREFEARINAKLDELNKAAKPEPAKAPQIPVGIEEKVTALQKELESERARAAADRLEKAITLAASEHHVAADRMEFLEFKLRKAHGDSLTDKGVPDETAPGKLISISALVQGLLQSKEGAVFRSAPAATSLPAASPHDPPKDGLPEFTKEEFEAGTIPLEIRKTGKYRIKEPAP